MNAKELKTIFSDWRVAVLIILIIGSLIAIYPHIDENGNLASNLQYGLDLHQGAWIQLELRAEVVGFTTDRPLGDFVGNLSQSLDADMELIDANHIEIRKYFTKEELEAKFSEQGGTLTSYQQGVSKDSAAHIKTILENKINSMGTKDAKVNTLAGLNNVVRYVRIELAGVNMNEAQQIVGKQGKFEIRVQTTGNQSEHVVFGDKISSVQVPEKDLQSGSWGVQFTLNEAGAAEFQNAAIKNGATDNPENHELMMILDNVTVYSAPLNDRLATSLKTEPVRQMIASTGTGTSGATAATNLEIHLRAGALPVDVSIAGSGSTSAPLGERYKAMVLLAGVLALIMVGCVIYFRYRESGIVLPMVLINASEVLILLGFIAAIKFQLDLPTIAGLIAVLGTGIDQLVIITDEILHEGKVPSPNLYLKRLARALGIIIAAAATVIIAMVPLVLMDLSTLKGFAIITILGVLVGVIITRPAYGKIIMAILSK